MRAMRQTRLLYRVVLGLILCAPPSVAGEPSGSSLQAEGLSSDGLKCKNRIVSNGATQYEVRTTCGEPAMVTSRVENRVVREVVRSRCAAGTTCSRVVENVVEVVIEEWTYDFGKRRLIEYLTFEQGILVFVRTGGYGRREPD